MWRVYIRLLLLRCNVPLNRFNPMLQCETKRCFAKQFMLQNWLYTGCVRKLYTDDLKTWVNFPRGNFSLHQYCYNFIYDIWEIRFLWSDRYNMLIFIRIAGLSETPVKSAKTHVELPVLILKHDTDMYVYYYALTCIDWYVFSSYYHDMQCTAKPLHPPMF